jgi:TRAP-type uncharacterized transport system substrate-binding protein
MSSRGHNRRVEFGRRGALGAALGAALLGVWARLGRAHTPYRQWQVYRKRHLLIVASKTDPAAYETGSALAAALAEHLPESKARPSRAPSLERVASLVASKQMDVAVLTPAQAAALVDGRAAFHGAEAVALRALFATARHLLVCRADFPAAHAYLVVQTLDRRRAELALAGARVPDPAQSPVPVHEGALAYLQGRPLPGAARLGEEPKDALEQDHPHLRTPKQ